MDGLRVSERWRKSHPHPMWCVTSSSSLRTSPADTKLNKRWRNPPKGWYFWRILFKSWHLRVTECDWVQKSKEKARWILHKSADYDILSEPTVSANKTVGLEVQSRTSEIPDLLWFWFGFWKMAAVRYWIVEINTSKVVPPEADLSASSPKP